MKTFLTAFVMLATTSAMAATTGTLQIQGVVGVTNEIIINAKAEATALNIVGGENNRNVAEVTEKSNSPSGYKINMKSANAGRLVHTTDNGKQTPYTVSYNGQSAISLHQTDQTVRTVSNLNNMTTNTAQVIVNVTPLSNAMAGTYQDTITISIVSN